MTMKEKINMKIAVGSGKGGVGKSMLASALAMLFAEKNSISACDCDVDAPNLFLWLNEENEWIKNKPISTTEKPKFDLDKCNGCGLCARNCKFSSLKMVKDRPELNSFLCEGCGACEVVCPNGAVKLYSKENGIIKMKETKYGFPLFMGQLYPGETGSGKIVSAIKDEAEEIAGEIQIIDTAPGTGCPVIAAYKDVDFAVLITEPTLSGFSDIRKTLKVIGHFNVPWKLVVNKWDINTSMFKEMEEEFGREKILGKISFDRRISKAVSNFIPVLETDLKAKKELNIIFNNLRKAINK